MFHRSGIWLASDIFGEIAEEHIDRPHLCCTKCSEMGGVRPEHERRDNFLALACWIVSGGTLDLVMLVQKHIRVVNIGIDAFTIFAVGEFSKQLERREMELL